MTNTYNFSFKTLDSALAASSFLLEVHKEVDGYTDWTKEKLAKHLMRKQYIKADAPMSWFKGFSNEDEATVKFLSDCVDCVENVVQADVEILQKVANSKPSGEEAYWCKKLSRTYSWKELKGLVFSTVQSSGKYTILPIPSLNVIYFSLNGGKTTKVSCKEVAQSKIFLIDYNIGLNTMGLSDTIEVENTNKSWYGLKEDDKSYEKLVKIMKSEFFHQ